MHRKILHFLNIPLHIKKLVLRTRINMNSNNSGKEEMYLRLINILIILFILAGLAYLNYQYRNRILLIATISILGLALVALMVWAYRNNRANSYNNVSRLILKDDDGRIISEWELGRTVSFLIGKKTKSNEVNIDLSNAVYASLISREHAVLNKSGKKWYFEDIGSSNGSGIRRKGESKKFKVEVGKPYEVGSGDILYIANTKLYIR